MTPKREPPAWPLRLAVAVALLSLLLCYCAESTDSSPEAPAASAPGAVWPRWKVGIIEVARLRDGETGADCYVATQENTGATSISCLPAKKEAP